VLSTPDAIGKVLERYIQNREHYRHFKTVAPPTLKAKSGVPKTAKPGDGTPKSHTACPECGSNVEHVSGCVVCYQCGWSKC
jgi:ribonucleoside-diphosphate reductase alpha chain